MISRNEDSKSFLIMITSTLIVLHLHGCDTSGGRHENVFMALQSSPARNPENGLLGSRGWRNYEKQECAVGDAVRNGYQITIEGKLGKASISPAKTALSWLANNLQVCTEWDSFQYPPTRSTCQKFVTFDDSIALDANAYFFHDICMKDLKTGNAWVSTTASNIIRFHKSGGTCVVSVMGGDTVSDMFTDPEYGFKSTLVSCASVQSGSSVQMDEFSALPLGCVKYGMCD
jgi:hypothetical protein